MSDSLVARGEGTADGATLFAKNSDRRGREPQPFIQLPAAHHPRGSTVRCSHVEIDQVAETYRVMGHSPLWCWGFEQGVNEHGVAIGNHATWSKDPLESEPGLIGMDLVRLGLERGRDAREALEVIATLVETHGQGGSAFASEGDEGYQNSFVIADGRSAWLLETTARSWAARSVERGGLTNRLTIGSDWQIASRDLERHALQQGFWSRDGRLDFEAAYAREDRPAYLTECRQKATERAIAGPPLTVVAMKEFLRGHGRFTAPPPADCAIDDADRYTICMHADPVSTTTASLVARLPVEVGRRPWPVWISFATPCTGLFVPVYLDGVLPRSFASGETPAEDTAVRHAPATSAWQVMRDLQECAARDFDRARPILEEGWKELERSIELERIRVEQESTSAIALERVDESVVLLTRFMEETADRLLSTARALGARLS
jgi:dipeptidase